MKVEKTTVIGNKIVNTIESHKGINIYEDDADVMYVCKDGIVIYTLSVDPFCGEGGGGSIDVTKID